MIDFNAKTGGLLRCLLSDRSMRWALRCGFTGQTCGVTCPQLVAEATDGAGIWKCSRSGTVIGEIDPGFPGDVLAMLRMNSEGAQ